MDGNSSLANIATTVETSGWIELQQCLDTYCAKGSWLFRGQSSAAWGLNPSLERVSTVLLPGGGRIQSLIPGEQHLIWRFRQRAHHFLNRLPAESEFLDWLALMQHHGAPTRLLDWTQSSHVATYFAVESARESESCAIWGIEAEWLQRKAFVTMAAFENDLPRRAITRDWTGDWQGLVNRVLTRIHRHDAHWLVNEGGIPVILYAVPSRLNERIAAQQGTFLCSLKPTSDFEQILVQMIKEDHTFQPPEPKLLRILVPGAKRLPILRELLKLNIHRASLFPDLDGFAKSIGLEVEMGKFILEPPQGALGDEPWT